MNMQTDKQELKKWLDEVEDQAILDELQSLRENTQTATSWANLPAAVKEGINKGRTDINAGRVISNEEFWKKYEHGL